MGLIDLDKIYTGLRPIGEEAIRFEKIDLDNLVIPKVDFKGDPLTPEHAQNIAIEAKITELRTARLRRDFTYPEQIPYYLED